MLVCQTPSELAELCGCPAIPINITALPSYCRKQIPMRLNVKWRLLRLKGFWLGRKFLDHRYPVPVDRSGHCGIRIISPIQGQTDITANARRRGIRRKRMFRPIPQGRSFANRRREQVLVGRRAEQRIGGHAAIPLQPDVSARDLWPRHHRAHRVNFKHHADQEFLSQCLEGRVRT